MKNYLFIALFNLGFGISTYFCLIKLAGFNERQSITLAFILYLLKNHINSEDELINNK